MFENPAVRLNMATMAGKRDYYEVLGVPRNASEGELTAAYRKLALKYHPDKNPGDEEAPVRFKEAAEAFEVLNSPEKRQRYDRFGHAGVDGPAPGSSPFGDLGELFEGFFGEGAFGGLGGRGGRRRRPRKGADLQCEVSIDLIEAARGVKKKLRFRREAICTACEGTGAKPGSKPTVCRYCDGKGQVVQSAGIFQVQTTCQACGGAGQVIPDKCSACRGAGAVAGQAEYEIDIPAGVDSQTRIRVTGMGNPSRHGGPPGDLYCDVTVREHPLFHREGMHLVLQAPIGYSQAVLGGVLEVPTLEGKKELVIPPGTQSHEVFHMRGLGMPAPNRSGRGDLVVQVTLEVPKHLTERQEKLLRELAVEEQANVSPHRKSFFEKLRDYFVNDNDNEPKAT